jgi:hypothetical protein
MSFCFPVAYADRGMIPVTPDVSVYEPGQKAIVAWNGEEELLILSTDVSASSETAVLEILPLPSMPVVEAASFQSFQTIQEMIWEEGVSLKTFANTYDARSGSVEVLFHEQIGAHNITVVEAALAGALVEWANSFLLASGVDQEIALRDFESVVEDYMSRGFRHYVLDIITFLPEERSIDPILYKFDSSTLYYPLLITSPIGGDGELMLFTLTEEKLARNYQPFSLSLYRASGGQQQPIQFVLSRGDLSKIDLRLGELFPEGAWLNVLKYEGNLGYLNTDLMISDPAFQPSADSSQGLVVELPFNIVAVSFLLGAVAVSLGIVIGALIVRWAGKK